MSIQVCVGHLFWGGHMGSIDTGHFYHHGGLCGLVLESSEG